jgi:hypothetical protein
MNRPRKGVKAMEFWNAFQIAVDLITVIGNLILIVHFVRTINK